MNALIYVLTTKSVPNAHWGTNGTNQASQSLNSEKQLTENALVGFKIIPALFFPARTSFIEYYYLVFDVNNLFLYASARQVEPAPAIQPADYSSPDTTTIKQNMASGQLFQAAQTGPYTGTAAARRAVVNNLAQLGFTELILTNDTHLNTRDYIDTPILCYMSNTNESNFAKV